MMPHASKSPRLWLRYMPQQVGWISSYWTDPWQKLNTTNNPTLLWLDNTFSHCLELTVYLCRHSAGLGRVPSLFIYEILIEPGARTSKILQDPASMMEHVEFVSLPYVTVVAKLELMPFTIYYHLRICCAHIRCDLNPPHRWSVKFWCKQIERIVQLRNASIVMCSTEVQFRVPDFFVYSNTCFWYHDINIMFSFKTLLDDSKNVSSLYCDKCI